MRIKIIIALAIAALSAPLFAQQQPVISIADSTGRRDAVVAIVVPTQAEIKQTAQSVAPPAVELPKPWPAYFLGQTKNFTRCFGWYCAPGFVKIENNGTISNAFHAGGGSDSQVLVNYIPTWNQVVSGTHTFDPMTFGGNNQTVTVGPTGITITNQIPTGWEVKVTNHIYEYSP
jgi:hypothetical protein